MKEYVSHITPLGYMADPAEIASAGLFLASAEVRYVTGIELTVDGGLSQIKVSSPKKSLHKQAPSLL